MELVEKMKLLNRFVTKYLLDLGFNTYHNYQIKLDDRKKGTRLTLGKNVSTENAIFNTVSGSITVGDETGFGYDVMVLTGQHLFDSEKYMGIPEEGNDIVIGKCCFIGSRTIIIKNVTIGDYVLIGAGSVVTKDIPSGCFAAGNPARVIRTEGK